MRILTTDINLLCTFSDFAMKKWVHTFHKQKSRRYQFFTKTKSIKLWWALDVNSPTISQKFWTLPRDNFQMSVSVIWNHWSELSVGHLCDIPLTLVFSVLLITSILPFITHERLAWHTNTHKIQIQIQIQKGLFSVILIN